VDTLVHAEMKTADVAVLKQPYPRMSSFTSGLSNAERTDGTLKGSLCEQDPCVELSWAVNYPSRPSHVFIASFVDDLHVAHKEPILYNGKKQYVGGHLVWKYSEAPPDKLFLSSIVVGNPGSTMRVGRTLSERSTTQ
jgi:hypothetical protein